MPFPWISDTSILRSLQDLDLIRAEGNLPRSEAGWTPSETEISLPSPVTHAVLLSSSRPQAGLRNQAGPECTPMESTGCRVILWPIGWC